MQVLIWIGVLSLLSAAVALAAIAWRTARGVRERESARVELLRALAFSDASAVTASGPPISHRAAEFVSEQEDVPAVDSYEPAASIFAERAPQLTALPRWLSLVAVGVAMALAVTLYAVFARGPKAVTSIPTQPIELVAIQHRFEPESSFEVSGLVRNPAGGRGLHQLVAVINLLDADGRILTSRARPVEQPVLEGGQTSAFSVVLTNVSGTAARYQVQFRLDGRGTVPHVDRRAVEPRTFGPSAPRPGVKTPSS